MRVNRRLTSPEYAVPSPTPKFWPRTLAALCEACNVADEKNDQFGCWVLTWRVREINTHCKTHELLHLVRAGLAENCKVDNDRRKRWFWRITELGRASVGRIPP